MFLNWGRWVYRMRKRVLWLSAACVVAAAVWGIGVFSALSSTSGFEVAGSESQAAVELEASALGRGETDAVILYRSDDLTVDDPAYQAAIEDALAELPADLIESVNTYWSTGADQFVSSDRRTTYAALQLVGEDERDRRDSYKAIRDDVAVPGFDTHIGGQVATSAMISSQTKKDIGIAEGLATPILLVLMILIFRSAVAATLPLIIGGAAVFGSFAALHALTFLTDISVYSINITTLLGVGLAIDYGLIMVIRFREELKRRPSVEDAVAHTMATAGRTVLVSGLTVAVALLSLLLFPQTFLRSMGFGGVATVLVDMLAALTVLPALLAVFGYRLNPWRSRRNAVDSTGGSHVWERVGRGVMRRPILFIVGTLAVLAFLGTPFLNITWGGIDARALPENTPTRIVSETLNREFPPNSTNPITVMLQTPEGSASAETDAYLDRLQQVDGVDAAVVSGQSDTVTRINVAFSDDRMSEQARDLVTEVRAVDPPPGAEVLVGGSTAELVDQLDSMGEVLPWMALTMALVTFVLLFLAFGSVVLPVKAILVNILSLSATFGAVVWIFQEGHLSGLLNFTPTGMIEPSMPILILAIVFGLSMDYEVFLLSRIQEHYRRTGDATASVAYGLQRTGAVITQAALLFAVVVGAFSTSGITFIKLTGVGMFIAVVVDATVVRGLLVPATMKLLGDAAWWAPPFMKRFQERFGIGEVEPEPEPSPVTVPLTGDRLPHQETARSEEHAARA
jgi:uncharacterized membrane protein YdfJ with MMPL/SSD domain